MDVVIAEDLLGPVPEWFWKKWAVHYDPTLVQDRERLMEACAKAKALVVRNRTQVDRALLERLPDLQVVGRLGVGIENLDLAALREREVAVVIARGGNANAVAEFVIAAMFEQARFLGRLGVQTKQGLWDRGSGIGQELSGKTLGLIGLGDIGQRVASRARVLGMEVVAYDPLLHPTHLAVQDGGVQRATLAEVCAWADYLSLHVPLTAETRHMIGAEELALMKPRAVLINTARGAIVDESALVRSLRDNPQRFAILDVREQEPPEKPDPLAALPNVLLTPHIAGITEESQAQISQMVLGDVDRELEKRKAGP
ncbi:hydroxyacid dehydrogenase [Tumebacillus sp. ITR2]|uniref:Hydroxyacid dehydrogenase n=1 Tax=Tumebacillus amylolyticus TaxID=2801339 RepID=A0ABS1J4L5_9BACL|nr:hydroxyacid dehydrogenase [Tumebacillus amylolyticus]MBL0385177.1 hydroxyacid dehydrogenase [Tumebacillus amylolyticus]